MFLKCLCSLDSEWFPHQKKNNRTQEKGLKLAFQELPAVREGGDYIPTEYIATKDLVVLAVE